MGYESIPFPTGNTPQALYAHAQNLSTQLRRILQDVTSSTGVNLTAINASLADLDSRIDVIESWSGGVLSPQQLFELSLPTASENVLGGYGHLYERTRSLREIEADATIMAAIDAHKANTGLKQEVRVRIEENLALVQTLTQLTADLGATNADVTTLTQTVADGDTALAAQLTSLTSTVAGNTASIQVISVSVDGISQRYGVTLSNNGEITGFISLDGDIIGSAFTVAADYFKVAKIGTSGGNAVPVFAIQTVGGVPKLAFRGDMYADGTIYGRSIVAGTITADKIATTSLSALSANLGTVTAGLIQNPAATLKFDLPNMRLYRTDGTMELNFNTKTFFIDF